MNNQKLSQSHHYKSQTDFRSAYYASTRTRFAVRLSLSCPWGRLTWGNNEISLFLALYPRPDADSHPFPEKLWRGWPVQWAGQLVRAGVPQGPRRRRQEGQEPGELWDWVEGFGHSARHASGMRISCNMLPELRFTNFGVLHLLSCIMLLRFSLSLNISQSFYAVACSSFRSAGHEFADALGCQSERGGPRGGGLVSA